ncbi:MAG: TrkH family potassium uptake protein [Oscillospiraceae bacterium]|jgi:trk system potassium uptake protein TrkH|nr:TrkH family potassium uptake protein [Oscillospiraceae bacterium]
MNHRMILKSVGTLMYIEAACLIPSLVVALLYGQGDALAFAVSAAVVAALGLLLRLFKPKTTDIFAKDGLAIVGFGWLLVSFMGALPFVLSGAIPSVVDALFESVSGFSTTGASILRSVESLPRGVLFWRAFTHWMGGLGFLVLMLALLSNRASALHIMKAESTGPSTDKFVPKLRQVAKILYMIYLGMTVAVTLLLLLGGMDLYDALIHAFGTASTGGFSSRDLSVGAFGSAYVEIVIAVFMVLCGVNFTLYHMLRGRKWKLVLRDEELRFYLIVVAAATLLIFVDRTGVGVSQSFGVTLRESFFQVGSIITTTGYATANFDLWPVFSQCVLLLLMFLGGSAGSTAGGLKCVRFLLLVKIARREVARLLHPRAIKTVTLGGKIVEEETLSGVMIYFFLYVAILALAGFIVALDGKDLLSSASAVLASVSNIGPGLGVVGPMGSYADFSVLSKLTLSACMILGRLEIYPFLLLCAPSFWRRVNI